MSADEPRLHTVRGLRTQGRMQRLGVTHTFAGVAVTDYAAAYQWYMRLFGRAADMFPHDGEAVSRLTPAASVYVVHDAERAGHSLLTLAVDDLDACVRHLRENGFDYSEHSDGGAPLRPLTLPA
jgi:hypothetical protein